MNSAPWTPKSFQWKRECVPVMNDILEAGGNFLDACQYSEALVDNDPDRCSLVFSGHRSKRC